MALIQSNAAKGITPLPYPTQAGMAVAHRFFIDLASAPSLNDIIEIAPLPALTRVLDVVLDTDDLDTGTSIQLDVGVMSGNWQESNNARTVGNEFIAGSAIAQTGGVARVAKAAGIRVAAAGNDRSIGVKIAAAAAGFQAGQIGLTVYYAAA